MIIYSDSSKLEEEQTKEAILSMKNIDNEVLNKNYELLSYW